MKRPPTPVEEQAATGETGRIYHDIRQTLRVSGVNLNFRTWAGFDRFFPLMWQAMRDVAGSGRFEAAGDEVRAEAARLASGLSAVGVTNGQILGESQRLQIKGALELYHYINPKLLVFTSTVARALEREGPRAAVRIPGVRLPRGAPPHMFPMEMVDEHPNDARIRRLFDDIKQTMQLRSVNSDYRTLAMWPDYLERAWSKLKPIVASETYTQASATISSIAKAHAWELLDHIDLDRAALARSGEDVDAVIETTARFERLLPPLILNIAVIGLDWWSTDDLARSPFPVEVLS
ncbi:MAG TPA: halocarboxylic acid dehydrogenase DehI family protein [Vicinamibacterales bacterium]|nr:halocarboxylic acid dehydrogenase DehI family protein [Vicinamibacterales bacterium]